MQSKAFRYAVYPGIPILFLVVWTILVRGVDQRIASDTLTHTHVTKDGCDYLIFESAEQMGVVHAGTCRNPAHGNQPERASLVHPILWRHQ